MYAYSPPFAGRCTIRVRCLTGILNAPVVPIVTWSEGMGDRKYLTAEEVAQRYRGAVSVGHDAIGERCALARPSSKSGKRSSIPLMSSTPGTRETWCRAVRLDD